MTYERDWSSVFWSAMLPICWLLAPVLTLFAHAQARAMEDPSGNKLFQSALFLAVFLALFGLVAVRILIARAIDNRHPRQAQILGVVSLAMSVSLIVYGVNSMAY